MNELQQRLYGQQPIRNGDKTGNNKKLINKKKQR